MAERKILVSDVEPLVETYNGNVAAIARKLGVSRGTVWARVQESSTLKVALENARETMLDNAESVLYRKVLDGSTPELLFFLKTQGRRRGYTEKLEVAIEQRVKEELGGRLDALAEALDGETYRHVLAILAGE